MVELGKSMANVRITSKQTRGKKKLERGNNKLKEHSRSSSYIISIISITFQKPLMEIQARHITNIFLPQVNKFLPDKVPGNAGGKVAASLYEIGMINYHY